MSEIQDAFDRIDPDKHEFYISKEKPNVCRVYRQFHGDKLVGRVVVQADDSYDIYNGLPTSLVVKALEYLGCKDEGLQK